jgi:hypothetical protein
MLEEAHSFFVSSHVENIEKHAKISEKPSQWLLERRARDEFSPAYTQNHAQSNTLNVLALGGDAIQKLMTGWAGMVSGDQKRAEAVDVQPIGEHNPSTLGALPLGVQDIVESIKESETMPPPSRELAQGIVPQVVMVKRGRGRPRKYPKPDQAPTPPTPPTP